MIDDAPISKMNVILAGGGPDMELLYFRFVERPKGGETWFVGSSAKVLDIAAHNRVHLVLIDPVSFRHAAIVALKLREICPEAVIAFFGDDDVIEHLGVPLDVKVRLSHYYRVAREGDYDSSVRELLRNTAALHEHYTNTNSYAPRYRYDVALTFAGEDRQFADLLANHLKTAGLHVFYDDFEKAKLWGKDLFVTLCDIYSNQARYCIMLISKAYVEKQWTVHERRSAQERVLNERDNEYLLPVETRRYASTRPSHDNCLFRRFDGDGASC